MQYHNFTQTIELSLLVKKCINQLDEDMHSHSINIKNTLSLRELLLISGVESGLWEKQSLSGERIRTTGKTSSA